MKTLAALAAFAAIPILAQAPPESAPQTATGQPPLFQPRGEAPVFQPRGQVPVFQPRGQAPVFQPRGQAPVFQPRGQAPVFQPRGQAPLFQPRGQAPVFRPRGPGSVNNPPVAVRGPVARNSEALAPRADPTPLGGFPPTTDLRGGLFGPSADPAGAFQPVIVPNEPVGLQFPVVRPFGRAPVTVTEPLSRDFPPGSAVIPGRLTAAPEIIRRGPVTRRAPVRVNPPITFDFPPGSRVITGSDRPAFRPDPVRIPAVGAPGAVQSGEAARMEPGVPSRPEPARPRPGALDVIEPPR